MDKLEFKNGSYIKIVNSNTPIIRSSRGEKYLQKLKQLEKYYHDHPVEYIEWVLGIKLKKYQKLWLKILYMKEKYLNKFKNFLLERSRK